MPESISCVYKSDRTQFFWGEGGEERLTREKLSACGTERFFLGPRCKERLVREVFKNGYGGNLCITYTGERGKERAVGVHMPTDTYTGIKRRIDDIISEKNGMVVKEEQKKKASLRNAQELLSQMEEDVAKGILRENEFNRYARILASTIYGAEEVNEDEGVDSAMGSMR